MHAHRSSTYRVRGEYLSKSRLNVGGHGQGQVWTEPKEYDQNLEINIQKIDVYTCTYCVFVTFPVNLLASLLQCCFSQRRSCKLL